MANVELARVNGTAVVPDGPSLTNKNSVARAGAAKNLKNAGSVVKEAERERPGDGRTGGAVEKRPGANLELYAPHAASPVTVIGYLLTVLVIAAGWFLREVEIFDAKEGVGYALGIAGAAMMFLLILYPIRKKSRLMRNWGATRHWFRAHMLLGIVGPVLILFHGNFAVRSLNSAVALAAMLTVAVSGVVGRFIYSKIHWGLYGRSVTLDDLRSALEAQKSDAAVVLSSVPALQARLAALDEAALSPSSGFLSSVLKLLNVFFRILRVRLTLGRDILKALYVSARQKGWRAQELRNKAAEAKHHALQHVSTAVRVAEFSVYERLMALWHLFHMPLFLFLVIVAVIHVVVVHMY